MGGVVRVAKVFCMRRDAAKILKSQLSGWVGAHHTHIHAYTHRERVVRVAKVFCMRRDAAKIVVKNSSKKTVVN